MYWKRKNREARARLNNALEAASSDYVKPLVKHLGLTPKSRKKTDAIIELLPLMQDSERLKEIYNRLNNMQQNAVAEAIYPPKSFACEQEQNLWLFLMNTKNNFVR